MKLNTTDLMTAAVFGGFGLFFCASSLRNLTLGSALDMGPGYFPIVLGILLIGFAILIALKAVGQATVPRGSVPWRAVALVSLSPIIFGLTVRGLGLGPATALASLSASFASRGTTLKFGLILAFVLTIFCIVLFQYGLGLPLPVFGYWLT